MATSLLVPGQYKGLNLRLSSTTSTRFKPFAFGATTKGCLLAQAIATLKKSSTHGLLIARGVILTKAADMGTGAFVDGGGGSDTITRSSGSFITDGLKIGDVIQIISATTEANDFGPIVLTNVAAGTLTFATATVNTAENFSTTTVGEFVAGTSIARVTQVFSDTVAANTGNVDGTPALNLLSPSLWSGKLQEPNRFDILPVNGVLLAAAGTALTGTDEFSISAEWGDLSV